ncbi:PREDICTED: transcription factor IIIA [Propithecus coquereli]|uniref:Transcription factor IIIA n=1 Tax=Propithecus coquereli TaxID=379532 RepID=A0A2K6F992_PROCO|nr:PREDICTED: transcription factor IIIA [Propithecus coquereli]
MGDLTISDSSRRPETLGVQQDHGPEQAGRRPPPGLPAHARIRRRRRAGPGALFPEVRLEPRPGGWPRAWPGARRLGILEPPVSVAEAVSSLTIAEAFVEAGESPGAPSPPPALPRRFICSFPDCSASYNKVWKLDAHLCKHTGERPFVCDHEGCGKAFVRDYHLSRHILSHTGEKPFVCAAIGCDQKFTTKSNLKKHFERKHENQQKQYVCNFEGCKKTFKKHQQLKTHQCQHTNEPLFKCTQEGCGKHFATPNKLKRHSKIHQGYDCQKGCSFVAKTWTELLKHVRETHREEITCEVCQKTFKRKDYLKQHMKTHAPDRDVYRCPREGCGRTYTTVFNLQSHILSFHEERRPFVCEHAGCGKTFAMKQSLTRHAIVHDPDRKKMKFKVKKSREKRSLASHLSGYIPPKRKQEEQGLPFSKNRELLNCVKDRVLATVTILTRN